MEDLDPDNKEFVLVPVTSNECSRILDLYEWAKDEVPFIPMDIHHLTRKMRSALNQGCLKHHLLMARFQSEGKKEYLCVCPKCSPKKYKELKTKGTYYGEKYDMLRDVDEYKAGSLFII